MSDRPNWPGIPSVTHARLRLAQGDVEGARRTAEALLAGDPAHPGARSILADAAAREPSPWAELAEEFVEPPVESRASDLAASFRAALTPGDGTARSAPAGPAARIAAWAAVVRRNREAERVR